MLLFSETVIVIRLAMKFQRNEPEVYSAVSKWCQAEAESYYY